MNSPGICRAWAWARGRRSVLLDSYTPSAGLRILIFSLLLNYMGCQSTVGDILSSEIYTNTQNTLRRLCTISFTPTQDVNHRLLEAWITALLGIDCTESLHQEEDSGGGSLMPFRTLVWIRDRLGLFFWISQPFPPQLWYLNLRLLIHEAKRRPHVCVLISQTVLFWIQTNLFKWIARRGMMAHARNSNTWEAEARY